MLSERTHGKPVSPAGTVIQMESFPLVQGILFLPLSRGYLLIRVIEVCEWFVQKQSILIVVIELCSRFIHLTVFLETFRNHKAKLQCVGAQKSGGQDIFQAVLKDHCKQF